MPVSCLYVHCTSTTGTSWTCLHVQLYIKCTIFEDQCLGQCLVLTRLSLRNRTIIMSIHQPRFSIYKMFDNLILLATGLVVYHGPAMQGLDFFSSVGKLNTNTHVWLCSHETYSLISWTSFVGNHCTFTIQTFRPTTYNHSCMLKTKYIYTSRKKEIY